MTVVPETPSPPHSQRPPRNPWVGFLVAALLLGGAVGGFVLMAGALGPALAGELSGQRTAGFVVLTPFLLTVVAVAMIVRAALAVAPWRRARALASGPSRPLLPRPMAVLATAVGVVAVAVIVALLLVARPTDVFGAGALVQVLALLAVAALLLLRAGVPALAGRQPAPRVGDSL